MAAELRSWWQLPPGVSWLDGSFLQWAHSMGDTRLASWPLMPSIAPTIVICLCYLAFCYFGQKYMATREAFRIDRLMLVYNVGVIALNLYLFIGIVGQIQSQHFSLICNAVDYGPGGATMARLLYIYYISKILDLSDTIFMILRKKFDQVTVLHVYHHCGMVFIWWMVVKWAAGGDSISGPLPNTFIHVVMYTYYLLAGLKIKVPGKFIITQLQMLQLFIVLIFSVAGVAMDCPIPHWLYILQAVFMITLLALFLNFYIRSYVKKKTSPAGRKSTNSRATGPSKDE